MGLSTLPQLESSTGGQGLPGARLGDRRVHRLDSKGVLGNVKVRQALSLALNRQAIISSVYKGAALMPRWIANPGTFGYGEDGLRCTPTTAPRC